MNSNEVSSILARFSISPTSIVKLQTSGFSGAIVWKIGDQQNRFFCLKKYPANATTADRLDWIHLVLRHAVNEGCDFVALPIETIDDKNPFVFYAGHFWELTHWVKGIQLASSDDMATETTAAETITDDQIKSVYASIARFHLATAQVNFDFRLSPRVRPRIEQLERFRQVLDAASDRTDLTPTAVAVSPSLTQLRVAASHIPLSLINQIRSALSQYEQQTLPTQPVVRDLRAEHLFFDDGRLTGLIDFDAMQMDSIAYDLSRLTSTWGLNEQQTSVAIEAYSSVRPIQPAEHALVLLLILTSHLLMPLQWIQWLTIEKRSFANTKLVDQRLVQLTVKLQQILE